MKNGFKELLNDFKVLATNEVELIGSEILLSDLQFPPNEALFDVLVVLRQLVKVCVA